MCGRFSLQNPEKARAFFPTRSGTGQRQPRYNIAPGETLEAVVADGEGRRAVKLLFWGFRPAGPAGAGVSPLVNARSETVRQKRSFREAFRHRRCILPADGFYEWRRGGTMAKPFHFTLTGGQPFALAGIWQEAEGASPPAFCLLTTGANDLMEPIHDRMPVILEADSTRVWLDPFPEERDLLALLRPFPAERMSAVAVAPYVNRSGNEGPACLSPWEGPEETQMELF